MSRPRPRPPAKVRQLRGFCTAAQTGSMSRAADQLDLSQPAISQQIRDLERQLGSVLFERRGAGIQLTPAGQVFYTLAKPLLERLDTLSQDFASRMGSVESGELDIAAGESTLLYLLPEFVQDFSNLHPGIQFRLHNVTGRDGIAMLRADTVDFAVGSMIEVPDDLSYRPIFTFEPMLITAHDHPLAGRETVTLEEVAEYGLILPPHHLSTWRMVNLVFRQHQLEYHVRLEAGGWEVIKRYVARGIGVSIVTSICLTGDDDLHAIPLKDYFPMRTYGVVTRRGKFFSPQARAFIELMQPGFFSKTLFL